MGRSNLNNVQIAQLLIVASMFGLMIITLMESE